MATVLRLKRAGAKKAPIYHLVAADKRFPRDGRFIEKLGTYNPGTEPEGLDFKLERVDHWLSVGALPTERVAKLLKDARKQQAEAPAAAAAAE